MAWCDSRHTVPGLFSVEKSSKYPASAEAVISVLALKAIELIERYAPVAVFLYGKGVIVGVEAVTHGGAAYAQDAACLLDTYVAGIAVSTELADGILKAVYLGLQTLYLE